MIKTREVPTELKNFNSVFNDLTYRYDASQIFSDFLSLVICCMAHHTQEKKYFEIINRYEKKEVDLFCRLFAELLKFYNREIEPGFWCDPLGTYYELLAGKYKKSNFGQFFTPNGLCDLMANFTINPDEWGKTINDPASGSGRLILASNAYAEGNYYVAQDLDHICVKMTAINMCFHKIRGEVHHMDSIRVTKPFVSYKINHEWHKHEILNILEFPKEQIN